MIIDHGSIFRSNSLKKLDRKLLGLGPREVWQWKMEHVLKINFLFLTNTNMQHRKSLLTCDTETDTGLSN